MKRITIGMSDEQGEQFAEFIAKENIPEQEAGRVAIERLLAKKIKDGERERAKLKRGNPNFKPKEKS